MAEVNRYVFSFKEVAEALIRKKDLHEGTWGIYVEFGIGATNIGDQASGQTLPAAIVPIINLGLQKFAADNPLAVDAAEVNPTSKKK